MKKLLISLALLLSATLPVFSQEYAKEIVFDDGEYWWGGVVGYGSQMPYISPVKEFDLALQNHNNQVVPLLLSSKGRYLWSDKPFRFSTDGRKINIRSDYPLDNIVQASEATLRGAYLEASHTHFPPTGTLPEELFFSVPQYNTWIELMYDQNQQDIINYAEDILANGFPAGVLMIDDNWQKHYGNFEFKPEKFPEPKAMIERLHSLGFKVMLWVCPFVSPDSPEYRELAAKGYLVKKKGSKNPAVIGWWNGQSASFDFTNPDAKEYYIAQLKKMQVDYGIDGFKFDAGDNSFYDPAKIDSFRKDAISTDHTEEWLKIGLEFGFNEYRAGWKMGGQPLVQRLGDKSHSWWALRLLIPEASAAGLLGYAYLCPDMIGGGQFGSFLGKTPEQIDQELIVRSAQVHALMPMMQFSVAPWRILDERHLEIAREAAMLHQKFGGYILECAKSSSISGEPILRHMEYSFPGEGFAECKDQFMLGDKYLVAPMVQKDALSREVKLPKGAWKDADGKKYKGGRTINFKADISTLPYFERVGK